MGQTLIIAAGGGGDAITAAALAPILGVSEPVVLTYSWDRLMIDPLPGPRTAAEFTGLGHPAPRVAEILPSTAPVSPAGSSLPRLAGELPARILLLDPVDGANGMAVQIKAAADLFHASGLAVLDVGGDIITNGTDPGLRSPLADQLALAASVQSGLPARLVITAPGLDGELPADTVLARLESLKAGQLPNLDSAILASVRNVFRWHPSEASGLLAAAADHRRGLVEVRDAGDQVMLSDDTTTLFTADAEAAVAVTPAARLLDSRSLAEAEETVREATGISEIRYETSKAARLRDQVARLPDQSDLTAIDRHAQAARERGAQYISARRLAELLGATTLDAFSALSDLLAAERPDHYEPSLYRTDL